MRGGASSGKLLLAGLFALGLAACTTPVPRDFEPPPETTWKPEGCRAVGPSAAGLPGRNRFTNLHADAAGSDEVSIAIAPVVREGWTAEPATFNVTGPVFDRSGNLYFAPLLPAEPVVLVSLDPTDGSRRFAIAGTGGGGGTPMVLADPQRASGEETIYLGTYARALAVRPDGTMVWDVSTGLTPTGDVGNDSAFGLQYLPAADALLGVTRDGHLYALDRATGAQLLAAPYGLLGGESEVANHFSVDAHSGRIWIAATAPDAADGTVDGVSELGALYALELERTRGGAMAVSQHCSVFFQGGSASTPALRADGMRVYVGDSTGLLISIDPDCNVAWSLDVGAQILGSVGVASDNAELYVSAGTSIVQVFERGGHGELGWTAELDMYITGPLQQSFNVNLSSITASAIGFQGAGGVLLDGVPPLPLAVGVGSIDRATGKLRYFTAGREETVAVMSTGPDGTIYLGNSPVRRAIARVLFPDLTGPLVGGITQYAPERLDLLIRDGLCAALERARNARNVLAECPASAAADGEQVLDLIAQARDTAPRAVANGDLTSGQTQDLIGRLDVVEDAIDAGDGSTAIAELALVCDAFP